MTLHETYAALTRRGMPGRPGLSYVDKESLAWAFWYLQGSAMGQPIHESDARDLITCHALRWQPGLNCMEFISNWAMLRDNPDRWLNAILAATEHLEPKESK